MTDDYRILICFPAISDFEDGVGDYEYRILGPCRFSFGQGVRHKCTLKYKNYTTRSSLGFDFQTVGWGKN